jgi:hypothetical protein
MKMKMKAGPRRDALVRAMFEAAEAAPKAVTARQFNRFMNFQAELQIALGLRKETDPVPIKHDKNRCPTCGHWW